MNNIGAIVYGGLGSQLFIIFTTISYYLDNNCKDYKFYTKEDPMHIYFWDTVFSNISSKVYPDKNITDKYEFLYFPTKEIPIYDCDTVLDGYFANIKLFEHNIDKIKSILGLEEKINNVLTKYPEYSINKTIVIKHIKNDRYTLNSIGEKLFKPIHNILYYIEAFKTLINKGVDIYDYEILYFCDVNDDNIACQYNLEINNALKELTGKDLRYKKVSEEIPIWEQLFIMTSAKHYIIPNCSLSWYGAYLSLSADPIVCYSNTWLGPKYTGMITQDLFPNSWNKIDEGYDADDLLN
jgi:hypothetical protein